MYFMITIKYIVYLQITVEMVSLRLHKWRMYKTVGTSIKKTNTLFNKKFEKQFLANLANAIFDKGIEKPLLMLPKIFQHFIN